MVDTVDERDPARTGTPLPVPALPRIPLIAFGTSLGAFLALTFVLCVLFDLWFPEAAMYPAWAQFLPGFAWLSWPSFFLGLVESVAYGWYVALIFVPLFNFLVSRLGR